MHTINSYYYRAKLGRKGEAWVTSALHSIGLTAKHRDFDLPDSHSGTDVTTDYNGAIATIEVKNLAYNPKHRCSWKWVLLKVVARFDMLDGKVHILAISYRDMLSQRAQSLLEALGIHIVQYGQQATTYTDWITTTAKQLRTLTAQTIKSLLTNHKPQKITTQNYDYGYSLAVETSSLEPISIVVTPKASEIRIGSRAS